MAVVQGVFGAFTDANNNALDITATLDMLDTTDVPLLSRVGKDSLHSQCVALKHEWMTGAMRSLDLAVAATLFTLANTTDPVTFNVGTGQGVLVAAGDVIKVDSELLRVTAVSGDAVTAARGFGGSTAASHADGSAIAIVGQVWLTDADAGPARVTTLDRDYNYVQAYNASVTVTSTEQAIEKYVRQNTLSAQLQDAMKVMWQTWERALIHGRKVQPTASVAGAMDGIMVKIGNAYAKAGAALTEDMLVTAQKDVWSAGGPQHLTAFVNAFQKQAVSKLLDPYKTVPRTERTAGGFITTYESDFGTIDFVLDRNIPSDTIMLVDLGRIGFGPLRDHAMKMQPLPQTTVTKQTVQIFGQYTSELHDPKAHALITGLATA